MAKNILLDVIIIISFVIYIKNENNITEQIDKDKNKEQKNISLTEIKLENISIIDDDLDINEIDYAEHIIIINTHEDQLVESIFYFLSFVLIIYIILFLYKMIKQNMVKGIIIQKLILTPKYHIYQKLYVCFNLRGLWQDLKYI